MKRPPAWFALLPLLLGACASPAASGQASASPQTPVGDSAGTASLDFGDTRQTIAGFGASGCWWAQDVGGWEPGKMGKIVELLFDRVRGIGLNIYRFEVGAGGVNESADPWRRAETFEVSPCEYDWGRCANAVNVLKLAVAAGADNVMFFANSPPGRMTVSGKTTGENGGGPNLRSGMEDDFARYLVDIALHFRNEGIPVKYVSPINEPQWNWQESNGQEGCHYEPDQAVRMAEALTEELKRRCPEIKPSLVDSGKWLDEAYTIELYKELANNPTVGPAMDHFAVHSYWSNDVGKHTVVNQLRNSGVNLPLWQTEWCQMEGGRDIGMDSALMLAETMHEDMTTGGCSAWIAWIAVSCYDYKDGLVYVDLGGRSVTDTKRLWALGNYSRFVREGYRRIGISGEQGGILASAYLSPDAQTAVLVAVNPGSSAKALDIVAEGFASYTAYETSASRSLERVASCAPGKYSFPAESVTTLVFEK
jgi:O-glycosyl hydrolase